eukprot:1906698-Rhodomonas_salina.1
MERTRKFYETLCFKVSSRACDMRSHVLTWVLLLPVDGWPRSDLISAPARCRRCPELTQNFVGPVGPEPVAIMVHEPSGSAPRLS